MTTVEVQSKVTKTGAYDGATEVDISGITAPWTLILEVLAMDDGNSARFVFEDSVDAFSDFLSGPSASFSGKITSNAPKRYTWQQRDFPNLRFGVSSAVLRLSLQEITGSPISVTYQAYLEY